MKSEPMAAYHNKHKGECCVVLGSGPALNDYTVEELLGASRWLIGINRSWIKMETPYHVINDGPHLTELKTKGWKTGVLFSWYKDKFGNIPEDQRVVFFERPPPDGWPMSYHAAGPNGVMLAYYMGFDPILMVGLDLRGNGKFHNTDGYYPKNIRWPSLEGQVSYFRQLAEAIKGKVRVINSTKGSALKCFPFKDLRAV